MSSLPRLNSHNGPLLEYVEKLAASGDKGLLTAKDIIRAVRAVLATPEGDTLLQLIDKATDLTPLDPLSDPRALAAVNAQRFIPLDLKRLAGADSDRIMARETGDGTRRSRGR